MFRPLPGLSLLLAAACAGRGAAPAAPAAGEVTLAIVGARIFDGEKVIPRGTVLVAGDRIAAVGQDVAVPAGVTVVDGAGRTLLPGLIDAHSHVHAAYDLEQALAFGVTTSLDMFGLPSASAELERAAAAETTAVHASLYWSGYGATPPGGHGTEYGLPVPTLSTPAEAEAWVDARVAEGAHYIKIIIDSGEAYGVKTPIPTLDAPTVKALVDAAHARGKLAVAHIGSQREARMAVDAGVDGLVHLFLAPMPDADFGRHLAERGVFVVPTLAVLHSMCDPGHGARLLEDARVAARVSVAAASDLREQFRAFDLPHGCEPPAATLRQLRAAKVPVLTGTDAPNDGTAHGPTLHEELALLVAAGLTPTEALAAATAAPARAFRLDDRGRIAPGLRADLLLVDGDPTAQIGDSLRIVSVWKAGRAVDLPAFLAAREAEHAEAEARLARHAEGLAAGMVSDFESGKLESGFGAGLHPSTDEIAGGKSTVELEIVDGGAAGTARSLRVRGVVDGGLAYAWSGVIFLPGSQEFQPVDLSSKRALRFFVRGQPGRYRLLFFAESGGRFPYAADFEVTADWREVRVELASVPDLTTDDVQAILWASGPGPGGFSFELDEITLE